MLEVVALIFLFLVSMALIAASELKEGGSK